MMSTDSSLTTLIPETKRATPKRNARNTPPKESYLRASSAQQDSGRAEQKKSVRTGRLEIRTSRSQCQANNQVNAGTPSPNAFEKKMLPVRAGSSKRLKVTKSHSSSTTAPIIKQRLDSSVNSLVLINRLLSQSRKRIYSHRLELHRMEMAEYVIE